MQILKKEYGYHDGEIVYRSGCMGVPITFLDKYCPKQFEIVDINPHFYSIVSQGLPKPKQLTLHNVGKKDPYARILIRKLS